MPLLSHFLVGNFHFGQDQVPFCPRRGCKRHWRITSFVASLKVKLSLKIVFLFLNCRNMKIFEIKTPRGSGENHSIGTSSCGRGKFHGGRHPARLKPQISAEYNSLWARRARIWKYFFNRFHLSGSLNVANSTRQFFSTKIFINQRLNFGVLCSTVVVYDSLFGVDLHF